MWYIAVEVKNHCKKAYSPDCLLASSRAAKWLIHWVYAQGWAPLFIVSYCGVHKTLVELLSDVRKALVNKADSLVVATNWKSQMADNLFNIQ